MKLASIKTAVRALSKAGVPYVEVDGLAIVAHGYGRQTHALNLVIWLKSDIILNTFRALAAPSSSHRVPVKAEGFADAQQLARWVEDKGMTVLNFHSHQHRETPTDVFVADPFDFKLEYGLAMVEEVAPGVPVRIGKRPMNFQIGGRYYAEALDDGPEWGMRFQITYLIPK